MDKVVGGGTDIRIDTDSLYARVIVAGGGSGSTNVYSGYAGGGETSLAYNSTYQATQTAAGKNGAFGEGASQSVTNYKYSSPGGGGGWYGGGGKQYSDSTTTYRRYTGGGSGYVYTSATASNYPSECLLNPDYYLTQASTIDGEKSMISPTGQTETGHSGNGYARITQII